ncbi:MAG: response regulator [Proteobacteria bacterium]|nr:response regulator [Pseudomonadota bacterium]
MLRKILFVDDDQILRYAVEQHLATYREHFSTIIASDGFDAVKKLKKMPFSLVILDLIMPRMDGMSLINHLRDEYPDIPIIIISGVPREKMQQLAAATDIIAYLSKPFQTDELVAIIMNTLREEAAGGIMHDVSPAVFLQFMEMDTKTCTIRIIDKVSKQGGILHFIDGQLVDARIGDLKGIDAALKVFTWDAATIFLRNDCPPREDTINSGLQPIIMKAAGMKDESDDSQFSDDDEDYNEDEDEDEKDTPETSQLTTGYTLDDLVLPNDYDPPPAGVNTTATGVSSKDYAKAKGQVTSSLDDLRDLLDKVAGIQCSRDDIHHDETMNKVVVHLKALGVHSQFGNFQVGYIATGKACDHILLPEQPAIIVNIQPDSPRDKIIELLRIDKDILKSLIACE